MSRRKRKLKKAIGYHNLRIRTTDHRRLEILADLEEIGSGANSLIGMVTRCVDAECADRGLDKANPRRLA